MCCCRRRDDSLGRGLEVDRMADGVADGVADDVGVDAACSWRPRRRFHRDRRSRRRLRNGLRSCGKSGYTGPVTRNLRSDLTPDEPIRLLLPLAPLGHDGMMNGGRREPDIDRSASLGRRWFRQRCERLWPGGERWRGRFVDTIGTSRRAAKGRRLFPELAPDFGSPDLVICVVGGLWLVSHRRLFGTVDWRGHSGLVVPPYLARSSRRRW